MTEPVKSTRVYDSARRQERSRLRRVAVLEVALALMGENGYVATPIAAIADGAGTSAEFIYKQFGDKTSLATRVLDFALVGDEHGLPMEDRPHIQRMIAEPDARVVLELYARSVAEVNGRAGAFLVALASAAPTDPRLTALWRAAQAKRFAGTRAMVHNIAGKAQLKDSPPRCTDMAWTLTAPELHRLLTRERRWSTEQYTTWVADTLTHSLLADQ